MKHQIVSHNPEFLVTCKLPVACIGTLAGRVSDCNIFSVHLSFILHGKRFSLFQKSSLQVLFSQSRFTVFASLLQV